MEHGLGVVEAAPQLAYRAAWCAAADDHRGVGIGVYTTYGGFLTAGPQVMIWFQAISVPYSLVVLWFFGAVVLYYLVWKDVVGYLNQVLGVA
jgi:hypothetical protein